MLILTIKNKEYELRGEFISYKGREVNKKRLLSKHGSDVVKITDSTGNVYDELKLMDLFNIK